MDAIRRDPGRSFDSGELPNRFGVAVGGTRPRNPRPKIPGRCTSPPATQGHGESQESKVHPKIPVEWRVKIQDLNPPPNLEILEPESLSARYLLPYPASLSFDSGLGFSVGSIPGPTVE